MLWDEVNVFSSPVLSHGLRIESFFVSGVITFVSKFSGIGLFLFRDILFLSSHTNKYYRLRINVLLFHVSFWTVRQIPLSRPMSLSATGSS